MLALALMVSGCSGGPDDTPPGPVAPVAVTADNPEPPAATCQERIDAVMRLPALPGAPRFEAQRRDMTRVRGRSLLWRRPPADRPEHDAFRKKKSAVHVVRAVRAKLRRFKMRKADRRAYVLREGYLWHHDVRLALALVEQVSLPKIFREKTAFIQRGIDIYEVAWRPEDALQHERFVYVDGPYAGEKAEVLLGDRVAKTRTELESTAPLHLDLRDVMDRSRFDRIKPRHLTEGALVAELRYGPETWVPALLTVEGARLDVDCEALTPQLADAKASYLEATAHHHAAMPKLRDVVRSMVKERIPFDADSGQTMGFLRKAWNRAYAKGWRSFIYEGESRKVYGPDGQAIPPQVCIDFLTDAWERAGGTWYAPLRDGEAHPKRTEGAIDFDDLGVENRRSVAKFAEFAQKHDAYFDVWSIPKEQRFLFDDRDAFYGFLADAADRFRPGDMLTVHGYKEGGRPHYHSLLVLELDPIVGVISLIASNAVFPREQTLEGILHISPKRSFRHRIRLKDPWLAAIATGEGSR
ncbi:MAG: hypothetical protein AAF715_32065 [Myxococcota bacterium]